MSHIKIIFLALLASFTMSVSAQDAYQEAVDKYLSASANKFAQEKASEAIIKGCTQFGKSEAECKAFVENEFYPQVVTAMTDAFKKGGVTIEDFNAVTAALQTPEGKKAQEDAMKSLNGDATRQRIIEILKPAIMAIMQGQDAQPVPVPEVSDSYRQKFHTYATAYNIGSSFMQMGNNMKGMFTNDPKQQAILEKLMKYLSDNIENLMLTYGKDSVTEEDLDFYNNLLNTPSGKKVTAATNDAMSSLTGKMAESMKKFIGK